MLFSTSVNVLNKVSALELHFNRQKMGSKNKGKVRGIGSVKLCRDVPWHSSKDNQIGLLFVVSYNCILHVAEVRHKTVIKITQTIHLRQLRQMCTYYKQQDVKLGNERLKVWEFTRKKRKV